MSPFHTALRSLFVVCLHHGITLRSEELAGVSEIDLVRSSLRVLRHANMTAEALKGRNWDELSALGGAYPVMAVRKDGSWIVVVHTVPAPDGGRVPAVLDPRDEAAGVHVMDRQDFIDQWDGTIVLCRRSSENDQRQQPFGLRWFLPEILKQAASFRGIAIATLVVNLISYVTPMMFQAIIDRVIPHHSYKTLMFVVLAFLVLILFECLFTYIRQNLMSQATNKIDARLTARTFQHLVSLPLEFFERTPSGELVRHMQQTERLRNFLTGRLFHILLDMAVLPILVVLLVSYSFQLTSIVVVYSVLITLVIAAMVPTFRHQLDLLYQAESDKQAHVIETLHGIRAVKSLVLEADRQKAWDVKVAAAVRRLNLVGRVAAMGGSITHVLDKLMQITLFGTGALAVFDGSLSMGSLVAFIMLSGRLVGPFLQIVGLVNDYQDAMLSLRMLGTVMNHPPERNSGQRHATPVITGDMDFDQVTFTYAGASKPALNRVSFKVKDGQTIGVVGRSGSGKTTVTRMIQAIHTAEEGLIRLNGVDIRHIDLNHLRRSIGVVLQENLLFRGSIRDNIAAAKPDASIAEVREAARMAGADEFIDRLPFGYDTFIEESATNFSGGQRQRLAIARALITQPRLLIFDEATSALDPESEAVVQANLEQIAHGRTLIIVSHRLASLVKSDAILVLEQGKLLDLAPHPVLLERCEIYRHLWQTQTQHLA